MRSFLIVCVFLCALPALATEKGTWQSWPVHSSFISVLADSTDLLKGMQVTGYKGLADLDEEKSSCMAKVYRPNDRFITLAHPDNQLGCNIVNKDGSEGNLVWSWAEVPFETWGNLPTENHCKKNGLPCNFQVQNHDFVLNLYKALRKQYEKNPRVSTMFLCGPYGVLCTSSYDYMYDYEAKWPTIYLDCHVNTEGKELYSSRCVFMYPEE